MLAHLAMPVYAAPPAAEPSQLDDQQLTGEPRIELREPCANPLRIRLTEYHPAECRRIDVGAGHSVRALAIRLAQTVGRAGGTQRGGGDALVDQREPVGKRHATGAWRSARSP